MKELYARLHSASRFPHVYTSVGADCVFTCDFSILYGSGFIQNEDVYDTHYYLRGVYY